MAINGLKTSICQLQIMGNSLYKYCDIAIAANPKINSIQKEEPIAGLC